MALVKNVRGRLLKGMLAVAIALPAASGAAGAAGLPFIWDPSQPDPPLAGTGSAFTADTINAANYLHSVIQAGGSFDEELVLKVGGFQRNGQPVAAPGARRGLRALFCDQRHRPANGREDNVQHLEYFIDGRPRQP